MRSAASKLMQAAELLESDRVAGRIDTDGLGSPLVEGALAESIAFLAARRAVVDQLVRELSGSPTGTISAFSELEDEIAAGSR